MIKGSTVAAGTTKTAVGPIRPTIVFGKSQADRRASARMNGFFAEHRARRRARRARQRPATSAGIRSASQNNESSAPPSIREKAGACRIRDHDQRHRARPGPQPGTVAANARDSTEVRGGAGGPGSRAVQEVRRSVAKAAPTLPGQRTRQSQSKQPAATTETVRDRSDPRAWPSANTARKMVMADVTAALSRSATPPICGRERQRNCWSPAFRWRASGGE